MPRIRQVDDVSIVDWGPDASLIGELRSLVEAGSSRRVLLNMSACDGLRADNLETLTEAFTVCEDRGCQIGMFAVSDGFVRLVEMMDLDGDLPPILGKAEQDAVSAIKSGQKAVAVAAAAGSNGKQQAASQGPIIDFDLDAAHAPTARFDHNQVVSSVAFAPQAQPPSGAQTDDDLLGIDWTPLVATGYPLGGEAPEKIVQGIGPLPATPAATPSTSRPTAASRRAAVIEDDGVIDLGDVAPAKVLPTRERKFQTEVLPAFELDAAGNPAPREEAERAPTRVLGGPQIDEDFSPVDTSGAAPPAFLQVPRATPHPTPTTPTPAARPSADRKSERYNRPGAAAPPAARPATPAPAQTQTQTPAAASGGPVNPYYESPSMMESDEQTVMISPGMLDAAMLASVSAQAQPAPPPAQAPAPAAVPASEGEDETVMFQPNALDAALLAEVAAVAGPEAGVPAPRVEEPPLPAPPPGIPAAAVAAAQAQAERAGSSGSASGEGSDVDGRDVELRLFLHDHALSTPLHLQVLDKLVKSSETTFGKSDLQMATGSTAGVVSGVLDQLVQSRLVRRTRSPRIRGGTGFIISASPQARNTLVRLLKAWQAPNTRAKVAAWLQGE